MGQFREAPALVVIQTQSLALKARFQDGFSSRRRANKSETGPRLKSTSERLDHS